MRLRNVKNATEILNASDYFIFNPQHYKGNFSLVFGNSHPIHLEIGCGKGRFLIEMAKAYPHINFIGMEKYESVLVRAIQKVESEHLSNIRFICEDAKNINSVFCGEICELYLNFSDPWPKKRHEKRRLTSREFLNLYDDIFKHEKIIVQKTDNMQFFAFSLEEFSKYSYTLEKVSLDLKNEDIFNIETEYEQKFTNLGYKILYVKAIKR